MYQNKIYRVTYFIQQALNCGTIRKTDWGVFEMNPDMDNKTIMRDIHEIKGLLSDIYGLKLTYNRKENCYEI